MRKISTPEEFAKTLKPVPREQRIFESGDNDKWVQFSFENYKPSENAVEIDDDFDIEECVKKVKAISHEDMMKQIYELAEEALRKHEEREHSSDQD